MNDDQILKVVRSVEKFERVDAKPRRQPAVHPKTRALLYVSASAIATFLDCRRKWWMTYVLGLRSPGSEATRFGSLLHTDVERYLEGERPKPETPLARVAYDAEVLPDPGSVLVEYETKTITLAGVPVRGFIDFHRASASAILVGDHKTMRTLRYAETSESLRRNNQMLIYTGDAMLRFPEVDTAQIMHIQYVRSTGEVHVVRAEVSRDHVFDRISKLEAVVEEMKKTALIEKLEDVPKSYGACDKYGGCYMLQVGCSGRDDRRPRVKTTGLFPSEKKSEKSMGLLDQIRKKKAEAAAQATPAEPKAETSTPTYPPVDQIAPPDQEPDSYTPMIDRPATVLTGVTAKRVEAWGISTVGDLKSIAEKGGLGDLKGVGPKLEGDLLEALKGVGMYEEPSNPAGPLETEEPEISPVLEKAGYVLAASTRLEFDPLAEPLTREAMVFVDCAPLKRALPDLGAELARINDAAIEGLSEDDLAYGRHGKLLREAYQNHVPRLLTMGDWYLSGDDPHGRMLGETLLGLLGEVIKTRGR